MALSIDLAKEVLTELEFLAIVNKHKDLLEKGRVLELAIYRYEKYWLPLVGSLNRDYPEAEISPPLDIYWIWHCHMLCPRAYTKDITNILGKQLDHRFPETQIEQQRFRKNAENLWRETFKDECSFYPARNQSAPAYESRISYNLEAAVLRQRDFFYNVSLPHFRGTEFLDNAVNRYKRFLNLKKSNRDLFVTPMYDIDLIWHTHQLHPVAYAADMMSLLGYVMNHDDSDQDRNSGSKLSNAHIETAGLYHKMYGESYYSSGCSYRGLPPQHGMTEETEDQRIVVCARLYKVLLEHMEVENLEVPDGHKFKILVVKLGKDNKADSAPVLIKKGPKTHWPQNKKSFAFDTSKYWALRFVLIIEKGVCCCKGTEMGAQCDVTVQCNGQSTTTHGSAQFIPYSNHPNLIKVKLRFRMISSPIKERPCYKHCLLLIKSAEFRVQKPVSKDLWGPVPVPPHVSKSDANVATHSLLNHSGRFCYKVKIIHSMDMVMSACLITDDKDQLQAVAHLIGTNQLPLPDNVKKKFPEVVTVEPKIGERAMLVKDHHGDSAVLVGRWELHNKHKGQTASTSKTNPGILHVKYLNLRRKTAHEFSCPSKDQSTQSGISFTYHLDGITIDMASRVMNVDEDSPSIAALIGAGLAVSMLFVLCNPWAGRPETQNKLPSPSQQGENGTNTKA